MTRLFCNISGFIASDISNVNGRIQLRNNLTSRSLGYPEELLKFPVPVTLKAFCYVAAYANGRTTNLIPQPKISCKAAG